MKNFHLINFSRCARFMSWATFTALVGLGSACAPNKAQETGSEALAINVSNRRPLSNVKNPTGASHYAQANNYYSYAANQLKAGMPVMFSASYGANGREAGQSRGVLVEKDGSLYYQQIETTTMQLLLPPGLTHNDRNQASLWDMKAYMDLVNRVAFAESAVERTAGGATPVYTATDASLVDFEGGTAGAQVAYRDAMELRLERSSRDVASNVSVYFAKGVGPVALEFRETGAVGGTFKIYIGDRQIGQNN